MVRTSQECEYVTVYPKLNKIKSKLKLSHAMRKYVLCHMRTTNRRPACASAPSDQRLCCLLPRKYNLYSCYTRNVKNLSSFCSWAVRFESVLVAYHRRQGFLRHGSMSWENVSYAICEQQKRRICLVYPRSMISTYAVRSLDSMISTLYIQSFTTLASFYSWAGWCESYLVANPEDTFSLDVALF